IECEGLRHALTRASDNDIAELGRLLEQSRPEYEHTDNALRLLEIDEDFHLRLIALSGNTELVRMLENLNGRIRYVRLMGLKSLPSMDPVKQAPQARLSAHPEVLSALMARDAEKALETLRSHINIRKEEATKAVQIAYSQIYVQAV
ncbi:MAG: GntR family transcriptional regulator, partial [Halocynthiibacter sp.]